MLFPLTSSTFERLTKVSSNSIFWHLVCAIRNNLKLQGSRNDFWQLDQGCLVSESQTPVMTFQMKSLGWWFHHRPTGDIGNERRKWGVRRHSGSKTASPSRAVVSRLYKHCLTSPQSTHSSKFLVKGSSSLKTSSKMKFFMVNKLLIIY